MKPHKHVTAIVAWAYGAEIQYRRSEADQSWRDVESNWPCWDPTVEYRVKPELKTPFEAYMAMAFPELRCENITAPTRDRMERGLTAVIEAYKKGELKL